MKGNEINKFSSESNPMPSSPSKFKDYANQKVAEWEKENGRSIKSLSIDEWLNVMSVIMVCPRWELEEAVNNPLARRTMAPRLNQK